MSNRRRRSGRPVPRPRRSADPVGQVLDELVARLQCCHGAGCSLPAFRWYSRADLGDGARLLVIPVCPDHFDQADREVCPEGHMEGGCLASADDPHFTDSPNVVVDSLMAAVDRGWGVALPDPADWHRLHVLRPLAPATP